MKNRMNDQSKLQQLSAENIYKTTYPNDDTQVGNSLFADDIWDLSPLFKGNQYINSVKKINFSFIYSSKMKITIKKYAYFLLGKNTPRWVVEVISKSFPLFIKYCEYYNIQCFSEINLAVFLDYAEYVKNKPNYRGGKLSPLTCYRYTFCIEELIKVGQIKGWDVPKENLFYNLNSAKLWLKKAREEQDDRRFKEIPWRTFDKILNGALSETDILTKTGIIILSQTGIRLNEVFGIKSGCISKNSNSHYFMNVFISKTEDGEPTPHKIFVNELVVKAVKELEEHTKHLRVESGLDELFLIKIKKGPYHGQILTLKHTPFYKRLKKFIVKWDIRDEKNELYHLQPHQFRVNFCNELIRKNVPIAFIMKHYKHVSVEMTDHYKRLKMEHTAKIVQNILKPDGKIAGINASSIKKNLNEQFKGKTEKEIGEFVTNLSKNMYINPLPSGICLQDTRRGDCDNGDGCIFINCPNYVTTEEYYPIHKRELDLLESEMSRYKSEDRIREYQRLKAKWVYLKPIVDRLEE